MNSFGYNIIYRTRFYHSQIPGGGGAQIIIQAAIQTKSIKYLIPMQMKYTSSPQSNALVEEASRDLTYFCTSSFSRHWIL